MNNKTGNKLKKTSNDIIYTPDPLAKKMIEMCNIKDGDRVLDPCYGGGVFYDNLPANCIKFFCEIEQQKDFFDFHERVDLVIGNPPYSLWTKWIDHTMKITDRFCYLMNTFNLTNTRVSHILNNGYGITACHLLTVDYWFGCSFIVIFEKNKPSIISSDRTPYLCDICNTRCKRGRGGNSMNQCSSQQIGPAIV